MLNFRSCTASAGCGWGDFWPSWFAKTSVALGLAHVTVSVVSTQSHEAHTAEMCRSTKQNNQPLLGDRDCLLTSK